MIIIALVQIATTPKFFVAESTFLSDNVTKTEVSGRFVDLLGISTSGSVSGSMRDPDFFPTIMNSQVFQLTLMKETFYFGTLGEDSKWKIMFRLGSEKPKDFQAFRDCLSSTLL